MLSPLSPHPSPLSRRGVSLLEVLISIGVLSVGLLSILMIIPLGQMTIAESVKADRAGACGRAVMRDLKVKRMLDFRSWVWEAAPPANPNNPGIWGWGWYDCYDPSNPLQYTRKWTSIYDSFSPYPDPQALNKSGNIYLSNLSDAINCFVIDPLGISKGMPDIFYLDNQFRKGQAVVSTLPMPISPPNPIPVLPRRSLSQTYLNFTGVNISRNPINGSAFIWPDDVAFDTPENGVERPFINSAGLDNNRSWDYSYLLTVTPSGSEQVTQLGPDQTMTIPNRRVFDVTVVVFFQRNFNLTQNANTNLAGFPEGEWMAEVGFPGMNPNDISPGGGTIALGNNAMTNYAYRIKGNASAGQLPGTGTNSAGNNIFNISNQLPGLRQNQWVMLWDSANGRLAWYRVTGINFPDAPTAANPASLTLDGPDWIVTNSTKLLVIDGAIGAYTSTVELDFDPLWQGMQ